MADLSERQRDRARYYGGKEYATRKRQASTVETGLRAIVAAGSSRTVGATTSTLDSPELHGLFTEAELRTLAAAACIVGQAAAHLGACAKQADRIQADYQKRLESAKRVLQLLPHTSIDDIIALCGVAYRTPLDRYECDDLRRTVERGWDMRHWLSNKARDAIFTIAADCAREEADPVQRRAEIEARLPGMKLQHATLIEELNALAVRERLEATA
ncbi:MAG: hypothetical protein AB1720_02450 [Pseudomonadota bacterium]